MKLFFIVNPISGGVNKEPFLNDAQQLCKRYGITLTIFRTTGKNDKEQLNQILEKEQPDKVAAVGGDGTVLFAAICLLDSGLPLGIIPPGFCQRHGKRTTCESKSYISIKRYYYERSISRHGFTQD